MEIITSRTNPLCTHLRKLASSVSYRRDCGEFLCDSPKLLEEALLWRADLRTVVCTAPRRPACPARCCPPRPGTRGFDEIHLSRTDAPGRPLRVRPAGPDASRTADRPPVRGPGRGSGSGECGDDPPDGGRLSRRRLFLVNACADLYNPKTVRASMGACSAARCGPAGWKSCGRC